ncbi:Hypothetical predicted protein [Scomber scombrus]|uniref:Uncharacterized protein n=1 Tax=Scomber scombrus TaxID=13677 RepID=A0AAV1PN64_SCOSC
MVGALLWVRPDLPPLSGGPPQQIEPPAGLHGARYGPMLRAHMPQSANSLLHTNKRAHDHVKIQRHTLSST